MRTGSLSPATYPADAITIRCEQCGRVGRYRREALIERYGTDAAMPEHRTIISSLRIQPGVPLPWPCEAAGRPDRAL